MTRTRLWLGIAISIVCLALALKDIRFADVLEALRGANYIFVLGTVVLTFVGLWVRSWRWEILFYPLRGLPSDKVFAALNIGYLLINILPARIGDVARAYLVGDLTGVSKARALSTIFVERVADVLVVDLFLAVLLFVMPVPDWIAQSGILLGAGFLVLAAFLVLLAHQRQRGMTLLKRLVRLEPWLDREGLWRLLESLIDGLEVLRHGRPAGQFVVGSLVIWFIAIGQFYTVMLALDLKLPITAAVFALCVTALGMTIPSSPGYVGVWEYVVILALSLFHVDKSVALAYVLVLHATVYVTTSLMGLVSLWRESLSLSILRQEVLPEGRP